MKIWNGKYFKGCFLILLDFIIDIIESIIIRLDLLKNFSFLGSTVKKNKDCGENIVAPSNIIYLYNNNIKVNIFIVFRLLADHIEIIFNYFNIVSFWRNLWKKRKIKMLKKHIQKNNL